MQTGKTKKEAIKTVLVTFKRFICFFFRKTSAILVINMNGRSPIHYVPHDVKKKSQVVNF